LKLPKGNTVALQNAPPNTARMPTVHAQFVTACPPAVG